MMRSRMHGLLASIKKKPTRWLPGGYVCCLRLADSPLECEVGLLQMFKRTAASLRSHAHVTLVRARLPPRTATGCSRAKRAAPLARPPITASAQAEAPWAKAHAAKISKMKWIGQSAGMEISERAADPTVLQCKDLMSDKMLLGIYEEERSSSRTLRSSCQESKIVWLGWALLTVEGVGLSVLVVADPEKWLDKSTVASES